MGMRSFTSFLAEEWPSKDDTFLYRWVPKSGHSASTMGINYGYSLEFAVVVANPVSGEKGIADPFNPLKGQQFRRMGSGWKPLAPLKPEGKITQKVIDAEIEWQRKVWSEWRRNPAESGNPNAHHILAHIMKQLVG